MPLNTTITRDGDLWTPPGGWTGAVVAGMVTAVSIEQEGNGIFAEPCDKPTFSYPACLEGQLDDGTDLSEFAGKSGDDYPEVPAPMTPDYIMQVMMYPMLGLTALNDGAFELKQRHRFLDTENGTLIELLPGDILAAWRS